MFLMQSKNLQYCKGTNSSSYFHICDNIQNETGGTIVWLQRSIDRIYLKCGIGQTSILIFFCFTRLHQNSQCGTDNSCQEKASFGWRVENLAVRTVAPGNQSRGQHIQATRPTPQAREPVNAHLLLLNADWPLFASQKGHCTIIFVESKTRSKRLIAMFFFSFWALDNAFSPSAQSLDVTNKTRRLHHMLGSSFKGISKSARIYMRTPCLVYVENGRGMQKAIFLRLIA